MNSGVFWTWKLKFPNLDFEGFLATVTLGRKTKQPKVVPDQNELDAELEAYNKGREKKVKENLEESADPLTESKDDDILKDSKRKSSQA